MTAHRSPVIPDTHPAAPLQLSDGQFCAIAELAEAEAGLSIPNSKKTLVQSRISRRMRVLRISSFAEYLTLVTAAENENERRELVSVLTTNVSSFFRERHHFDHFASILPALLNRGNGAKHLRIWSAGCSRGQEPFSIAMEILRACPDARNHDIRILASDIDPAILVRASEGTYCEADLGGVSPEDRARYFDKADGTPDRYRASADLKALVRFRELNLHGNWPMAGRFDAIFCRNVVIYFDDARQRLLWPRFHAALQPGGWLYLGHSERISPHGSSGFTSKGVTVYQRE